MIDIHPTETAGDGKRLRDEKHLAPGEDSESLFIACPHCGMMNKTNRDSSSNKEGEGIEYLADSDGTTLPNRRGGCLLCGHDYTQSSYRKPFFSSTNIQGR